MSSPARVGTLAGFGPRGIEMQARVMQRLGLGVPAIAWHAARDSITEFVTRASRTR